MSELPEGWATCAVNELFESFSGGTPSKGNPNYWNGSIPWISSGEFGEDEVRTGTHFITEEGLRDSSAKLCQPGSVLVVVRSGILKHTLPVAIAGQELAINQDIKCFDSGSNQLNRWLALSLRAQAKDILAQNREGTTVQSVKYDTLKEFELSIPPLNEQRRIVAKLEKLLSRVDAASARLANIPRILKRFRQSVLAAACSGRLTADWRVQKNGNITTTVEFLGEIEIPANWNWKKLPELGFLGRGKSKHRPRDAAHLYGGEYPFIQTGSVARSNGRITNHTQTYSDAGLAQSKLWEAGTVCITIAANIADSAILTYPACFPDSVVGFVADKEICFPEYVEFFIRTAREDLLQFAPATAQKNINLSILNELLIPLPTLAEQQEIVRRVEALFQTADALEARYRRAQAYVDKLTQSILARAFRGELVPTEAELARREGRDYESAAALLERISRVRARQPHTAQTSRPPRKKKTDAARKLFA